MPPTPKFKKVQNLIQQKRFIFKGFTQNGLHNLFQRKKLYRLALGKIYFDDFCPNTAFGEVKH